MGFIAAQNTPDVRKVHGTQPFDMGEVCSDGIYGEQIFLLLSAHHDVLQTLMA